MRELMQAVLSRLHTAEAERMACQYTLHQGVPSIHQLLLGVRRTPEHHPTAMAMASSKLLLDAVNACVTERS